MNFIKKLFTVSPIDPYIIKDSIKWPGLTAEQAQTSFIKNIIFDIVKKKIRRRIISAKHYSIEYIDLPQLNGIPVVEIIFSCNNNDQYCSGCDSYGCPGGC